MKIEVLFSASCGSCRRIETAVHAAVEEMGLEDIEIVRFHDFQEAQRRGATSSPALFFDGKLVVQGRYPSIDEIKEMINRQKGLVTDISTY
jgi:small redox-active disulfide protein 2